jgi:phosphoribosylaminoimidazolecarboxamide formyltransferase / IMP cyclohydrolase
VTVKRALISVSDKTGLLELAQGLVELGVELIATSGTAAYLAEHGLEATRVEDLTGVAEMLGGRVKTLHPSVHGALLARRDDAGDQASLAEHGIEPIDLVIVNLYPFRHVAARRESSEGDVVEAIDIGGPAMVRAAAKNFAAVAVLVDPERYGFVLDELRESSGDLSLDTRRELAAEAFAHTAGYDIAIANWFSDTESFPERQLGELVKVTDLAYGENPHQRAAYYMEAGARRHLLSMVTQHGGKQLSFNNLLDLDAATKLVDEFTVPACVIVKHGNPCGCALASTPEEAYRKALASDPASAFGGVVAVNRPLSRELAALVAEQFVEVLHAPGYGEGAVDLLREKLRNLRLLESDERRRPTPGERDAHKVLGGMLIQDRDTESEDRDTMEVVAGAAPTEREWGDLMFAWRVVKHVRSNAIVITRDTATVGIGAGQMSRIDSTRLALGKALSPVAGAVLASDAFFPFADGVQAALDAGVRVIIEPGGSKRDDEVIAAVEKAGGTLVFTGRRHFSH